ncbi:MAG: TonB C-terminal domain-containing protein [Opitutaceae bacterium]|jgi:colicin import membrane protein|nr:TonB C-terminal domain-containing protein [Opitutaceae bacterium]
MSMGAERKGAFFLSAALHAALIGALFVSGYVARFLAPKQKPVFEVVAGPGDDFAAPVAGAEPPAPPPVELGPVRPLSDTPVVAPPPDPVPKPEPDPGDKPPPKPPPPKKTPKPKPPPAKPLTYEEFLKQQQGKKPAPSQAAPTKRPQKPGPPVKPSLINTADVLDGASGAGGTASRSSGDAVADYLAWVVRQLREAHEKPAGLGDLLGVEVAFRINADGTFSGMRVARSSGNAAFDASALDAFRRVRVKPPPPGAEGARTILFKTRDE